MEFSRRQKAKFVRGKGQAARLTAAWPTGITLDEWSQRSDPLYRVKGKERHRRSLAQ